MTTITPEHREGVRNALRLRAVKNYCEFDPKPLIAEMSGFDPTLQENFSFIVDGRNPAYREENARTFNYRAPWAWQSLLLDLWMGNLSIEQEMILKDMMGWWDGLDRRSRKFIILKARQLGITWLAVALGLWFILFRPGANVVAYSHGQEEAKLLIGRAWLMFQSLDPYLREHMTVIYPDKAEIPSDRIVLRDNATGKLSIFKALPDTPKAGHGDTVTLAISDELARQKYGRGIYAAINPAVSRGGIWVGISTADGVSNLETGEGNFFHHLWATRKAKKLQALFLPWNIHPERDEEWYQTEAMALPHMERNQQYPLSPEDAFILSGDLYFEPDSLEFYRGEAPRYRAIVRGKFVVKPGEGGTFVRLGGGWIDVYEQPVPGKSYVLSGDTASGRSTDYSVGDVMDLETGQIVASIRCKIPVPEFADQLKLLGRWYNDAHIIPERTGIGEALIGALRSNANGLRPYSNMYQHVREADIGRDISGDYGFPTSAGTRGQILEGLRGWVKDRKFPYLPEGHVDELGTFIYRETGTSPRAMEGCNDDRVMSLALCVHVFEKRGETATKKVSKKRRWRKREYTPPPTRSY